MATQRKPRDKKPKSDVSSLYAESWFMKESALREFLGKISNTVPTAGVFDDEDEFDNVRGYQRVGDVGVISVRGPLLTYASWVEWFGYTSYQTIEIALSAAIDDPQVKSIVFSFDSPGGSVSGCGDLAAKIAAAKEKKPVCAYVSGTCASAAYWLATACGAIYISQTAILGSIGCVCCYLDDSKWMEKNGFKDVEIVSSQSPKKRLDPSSDEGRASIQQQVDDLASVFVSDVAKYRGVSVDTVLSDFGQGDVFVGAKAIGAGLADGFSTFEDVVAKKSVRFPTDPNQSVKSESGVRAPDAETSKSEDTDVAEKDTNAAAAERTRISAILTSPEAVGREATAQHFALNTGYSADEVIATLKTIPKAAAAAPVATTPPTTEKTEASSQDALTTKMTAFFDAIMSASSPKTTTGFDGGEKTEKTAEDKEMDWAEAYAKSKRA